MSHETRPKPTYMLICDLCGDEIPETTYSHGSDHRGTVTRGYTPLNAVTNKTGHALLRWPPSGWKRTISWQKRQEPEYRERSYDFHGECIVRLVEDAIATKAQPAAEGARE